MHIITLKWPSRARILGCSTVLPVRGMESWAWFGQNRTQKLGPGTGTNIEKPQHAVKMVLGTLCRKSSICWSQWALSIERPLQRVGGQPSWTGFEADLPHLETKSGRFPALVGTLTADARFRPVSRAAPSCGRPWDLPGPGAYNGPPPLPLAPPCRSTLQISGPRA